MKIIMVMVMGKQRPKDDGTATTGRFYIRQDCASVSPRFDVHIYPSAIEEKPALRSFLFKCSDWEYTPVELRIYGVSDKPITTLFGAKVSYVDLARFKKNTNSYRFQLSIPARFLTLIKKVLKNLPSSGPITVRVEKRDGFRRKLIVLELHADELN
ncbi:hypothetical protein [Thermococcus prieurii]